MIGSATLSSRSLFVAVWLAAFSALAATPLATAKQALAAGKPEEVLFALDGKSLTGADQLEAAQLLAQAARKSLESKDPLFAVQLAQRSLLRDAKNEEALEVGARAFLLEQQFTPAEQYADRWMAAQPQAAAPRILRAEIAEQEGEWDHALALTDPLTKQKLSGPAQHQVEALRLRAQGELQDRAQGMSTLRSLDARFKEALAQAEEAERNGAFHPMARATGVVVYGTSWCGFCKKAREYFTAKHVPFEDKDVEKDPSAAKELAQKEAAQHVHSNGVPIIDVHGQLVMGFDKPKLDQLLGL